MRLNHVGLLVALFGLSGAARVAGAIVDSGIRHPARLDTLVGPPSYLRALQAGCSSGAEKPIHLPFRVARDAFTDRNRPLRPVYCLSSVVASFMVCK